MKKIIFLLLIAGLGVFQWKKSPAPASISPESSSGPAIYSEFRFVLDVRQRNIEGVFFGKYANMAACQKELGDFSGQPSSKFTEMCPSCRITKGECKTELASRYQKLFDNQPSNLTYLSVNNSNTLTPHFRVIYWGLTAEESRMICNIQLEHLRSMKLNNGVCIQPA